MRRRSKQVRVAPVRFRSCIVSAWPLFVRAKLYGRVPHIDSAQRDGRTFVDCPCGTESVIEHKPAERSNPPPRLLLSAHGDRWQTAP
jgi:hypothetical protein